MRSKLLLLFITLNFTLPAFTVDADSLKLKHDSLKTIKSTEKLVDILGVERGIFYHISYAGGPKEGPVGKKDHILAWWTHKEIPKTYFSVEIFCWNRWVKRGKIIPGKGIVGTKDHSGRIPGKYYYTLKVPPHSGHNKWRVVLMNDSNVCIGVSKELDAITDKGEPIAFTPKIEHNHKKKIKEIQFSNTTYYELYDASGKLVAQDYAKFVSYLTLDKGSYTLYYDNTSTSFENK